MARIEKLSRIRGLNPYEVKKNKEESQYNKAGPFSDDNVLKFNITQSVNVPTMLPLDSELLTSELTTSIVVNAKTPINANSSFGFQTQNFSSNPFNDSKIYLSTSSYYTTGSSVAGFGSPLKNKKIIELTLPINSTQLLESKNTKETPFGYYNFSTHEINPIGENDAAEELANNVVGVTAYFNNKAFGFGPSIKDATVDYQTYLTDKIYQNLGLPITEFGFPSSPTYNGTSEHLLRMDSYIKEPFVLEKIQIQFSELICHMNENLNFTTSSIAIATAFLLNKRKSEAFVRNATYKYFEFFDTVGDFPGSSNVPFTNLELPYYHAGSETNDLVSFCRMACVYNDAAIESKIGSNVEYLAANEGPFSFSLSSNNILELTPNTVTKNDNPLYTMYFIDKPAGVQRMFSQKLTTFNGTRSNTEDFSARNQIKQISCSGKASLETAKNQVTGAEFSVGYNPQQTENIPYILFPEDSLILGFQAPIFDHSNFIDIVDLTSRGYNFYPTGETNVSYLALRGVIKITLFGSCLKMNESLDYVESHSYDSNETALNTSSTVNIGEKK